MDSFSEVVIVGKLAGIPIKNPDGTLKKVEGKVQTREDAVEQRKSDANPNRLFFTFNVGVETKRKDPDNPKNTLVKMDWIDCICWDERIALQNLKRGEVVKITGRLSSRTKKIEGAKDDITVTSVVAERVQRVIDQNASWEAVSSGSVARERFRME